MNITRINQLQNLAGKTIILRAGLNVPVDEDGVILDDFRIMQFIPTLLFLIEQEARIVIITHLSRDPKVSLQSVADCISRHVSVTFKKNFFIGDIQKKINVLQEEIKTSPVGSVWLLDNVRACKEEKLNDEVLAKQISELGDVYINEAFSVSHRTHMSVCALASCMPVTAVGFVCGEEIDQLSLALSPPLKSIAIIGGNKFSTKLSLINKCAKNYRKIIVGGALANTLYYIAGYEVGRSVYESDISTELRHELMALLNNKQIYIPSIVVVKNVSGIITTKHVSEVAVDDYIFDISPDAFTEIEQEISEADLIVWNGPLGYYEENFTDGTQRILELIVANHTGVSIIGGGNTVDAVRDLGYEHKVSFLSTGGGAMIEFVTQGTLPALQQLKG